MTFFSLKRSILLMFIASFFTFKSSAQINNKYFTENLNVDSIDSTKKIKINIDVLSYLKNNEYFSPTLKGFTLFGHQIATISSFSVSKYLTINVGGLTIQDYGNDRFTQLKPIFSLIYQKKGTKFIFGNIEGNLKHQLIEPLFNFEKMIQNPLENGIQLKTKNKRLSTDTWIDWQKAIFEKSTFQEEIWGGTVINLNLKKDNKLNLVSQFTAKHKGGQINIGASPIQTTLNFAIGLDSEIYKHELNGIKRVNVSCFYTFFATDNPEWVKQKSGNGLLANLNLYTKWIDLSLNYWRANQHISPSGGDLYQTISVNYFQPEAVDTNREILIFRLIKEITLDENLKLMIRIEPYFNLKNAVMEHSEGIYLKYNFTKKFKSTFQ